MKRPKEKAIGYGSNGRAFAELKERQHDPHPIPHLRTQVTGHNSPGDSE